VNRYANILFDLDGTIADSAPDIIACVRGAFAEVFGAAAPPVKADLIGFQLKEILLGIDPSLSPEDIGRLTAAFRGIYDECGFPGTRLYAGAAEALAELKTAGARLFLVTNKPDKPTRALLLKFGLDVFEEVVCPDSVPGRRMTKSEMIGRLLGLRSLEKKETVMIGDFETDILAARENGIAAIAALYGYGDAAKLRALAPDRTLTAISGLAGLVTGG